MSLPESWLEMLNFHPHPDLLNLNMNMHFNKSLGNLNAPSNVRSRNVGDKEGLGLMQKLLSSAALFQLCFLHSLSSVCPYGGSCKLSKWGELHIWESLQPLLPKDNLTVYSVFCFY